MTFLKEISNTIIQWHHEMPVMMALLYMSIIFAVLVNVYPHLKIWICKKKLKKLEEPLFMHYFRNYGENIFQETILDEIRQKYDFKMLKLVGIVRCMPNPDKEKLIRTGLSIEEICERIEYYLLVDKGCIVGQRHPIKSSPDTQSEAATPPQSQPRPSSPGAAQNAPTTAREPILVLAPYIVDYIITQFVDSDFCFDEVLGVPDEVRKDLTKYTAIGAWVDEKDPLMRYMEVCNNDITFYKILESPALLSFKITEKEKYQKVHFSMIVAVNDEISTYMLNRPAPMHQLDDADYKRLEQSLLLRRQDIEDKYNLGNFQDYVERVKITIPLKTSPEAPTPPQSQPRASTPTPAQQAPTTPPKAPSKPKLSIEEELLNYLKTQPICWEFPLTTQDKALNQFCEALVFSDSVTGVGSNEAIKNLELTIQKKRARNPRLADHNAAMEGNILAILYEYSYLMHIFHALDDMKFDTTKVDIQKLWLLIQKDCNARINNLAEEKRKNPTIQIVLDKYNYDHQITQLNVLKDATGREMDYIISFIMAYSLLTVISLLLGNPKLLQPLKPYSADDIAGMMNALINVSAGLRFTGYSR